MKLLVALTLLITPFSYAVPPKAQRIASELKMNPRTVRVKLSGLGRVMHLRGTGLALSLARKPELGNVKADQWLVDCKTNSIYQPSTTKSRKIPRSGILIESLSGEVSINSRRYGEQIVIYPKELRSPYDSSIRNNDTCLVVNHVNLERYLESVVNNEFNSQWAESAGMAQVIAARTYALYQMKEMRKDRGRVFDVESTEKDQVYSGLDRVDSKATQLVAKTRGMIMVAKNSRAMDPIKAFYHSTCGGRTLVPEKVWGAKFAGFTKGVPCPFCANSPVYNWDTQMSFHDIETKIVNRLRNADPDQRKGWPRAYIEDPNRWFLLEIKVDPLKERIDRKSRFIAEAHADEPDRAANLIFNFVDRNNIKNRLKVKMDAYQARNWLDPWKLKSTWFSLTQIGRSIVFRGRGSGHGVGMCQWGAKRMGEKGFTKEQILNHYYPHIKIARVWK